MQVSVIIPVYNCEPYLRQAVASALALPAVGQVVLVEDGSPDNALAVCEELVSEHADRVELYRHPRGENRGAGASRNLGVSHARHDVIAFLDGDDYYLPNRFDVSLKRLADDPAIDGVYEAIGTHFENDAAREKWFEHNDRELFTLRVAPEPRELFHMLVLGGQGAFQTNAVTMRKALFNKVKGFPPHMRLAQDTALWLKMAIKGRLVAGNITSPVAMRRVHEGNRCFVSPDKRARIFQSLWRTMMFWSLRHCVDKATLDTILKQFQWGAFGKPAQKQTRFKRRLHQLSDVIRIFELRPGIVMQPRYRQCVRQALSRVHHPALAVPEEPADIADNARPGGEVGDR